MWRGVRFDLTFIEGSSWIAALSFPIVRCGHLSKVSRFVGFRQNGSCLKFLILFT